MSHHITHDALQHNVLFGNMTSHYLAPQLPYHPMMPTHCPSTTHAAADIVYSDYTRHQFFPPSAGAWSPE